MDIITNRFDFEKVPSAGLIRMIESIVSQRTVSSDKSGLSIDSNYCRLNKSGEKQ